MKHVIENIEELYRAKEPTGELIIDEVVEAVRKTMTQKASDIALLLDVDRRSLSIAFELLTGITLDAMLLEWRMLQARDLLNDKNLSISEVANRCGFKRPKNLIIAFRHRWGTTPNAYRTGKLNRNSNYVVNKDYHSRKNALLNAERLKDDANPSPMQTNDLSDEAACPPREPRGYDPTEESPT